MDTSSLTETFTHVRIVLAMVIGLGITRILTGVASFIQHPKRHRVSLLHMLWVASILLELVLFWWWDVRLARETDWNFRVFLLQISYAIVLFLVAALLFPDNIIEYAGYEDFFIQRRRWFFSLLAATWALDLVKSPDIWRSLTAPFLIQASISVTLCVIGIACRNRTVQLVVVLLYISRQIYSM